MAKRPDYDFNVPPGLNVATPRADCAPLLRRFYGALCRFYGALRRFYGALRRFHGALCRFYGALCRFYCALCRFYGALCRLLRNAWISMARAPPAAPLPRNA